MTSKRLEKPLNARRINIGLQALADVLSLSGPDIVPREIVPYKPMPGVIPTVPDAEYLAHDSQSMAPLYTYANQFNCGMGFPGYPYLAQLAMRSEYRAPSETIANEMTRKWIKFTSKSDGDKADKIADIEDAFKEFNVQECFRRAAEIDGFFGRSQMYIAIKGQEKKRDRPLMYDEVGIKQDSLEGFKVIEPVWTSPLAYNSIDPASPDFYKPKRWYVMGVETHATRLLSFVSHEVPDLLKPAYNFGGISMTQLVEPYVVRWLKTVENVNKIISRFSVSGVMTNMASTLEAGAGGAKGIIDRAKLFTKLADNFGMMLLDKDTEEFFQFNIPLSSLDKLQAQAQEHMAAPTHIPLVKLFGISPAGLNATPEGEIKVFYDFVLATQESLFTANLESVLKIIQCHLFGAIDEDIGFEYVALDAMTGKELSEVRKSDADAGVAYINAGVISPEEERDRLMSDPDSGYTNLTGEAPPPPLETEHDLGQEGADADHARGEESADNAHKRTLEAQTQAAKLAPKPAKKVA